MASDLFGTFTNLFGLVMVGAIAKEGFKMFGDMSSNAVKSSGNFFDFKLK